MQIRRFEGKDMPEALRQVKKALGEEAIILSTHRVKRPSARPRSVDGSWVEVVAAADRPLPSAPFFPAHFPSPEPGKQALPGTQPPEEDLFIRKILTCGLIPEFVNGLVEEIRGQPKEGGGWKGLDSYRDFLRSRLMAAVDVAGPYLQGAKIWAFIGPTGVGKTTTLAKLAAHFSLRLAKRITLITMDTYRIGAIEQLKTYARILKLPLEVAATPEELKEILTQHADRDLLLIDTAGRNPYLPGILEELKEFLAVHPAIENHLVLSATMKDRDLAQMVHRFSLLPVASYIITKIDETEEYVPVFNQLLRYRRPLSYLTNGQRVPEDIELATKGRVANMILHQMQWN